MKKTIEQIFEQYRDGDLGKNDVHFHLFEIIAEFDPADFARRISECRDILPAFTGFCQNADTGIFWITNDQPIVYATQEQVGAAKEVARILSSSGFVDQVIPRLHHEGVSSPRPLQSSHPPQLQPRVDFSDP